MNLPPAPILVIQENVSYSQIWGCDPLGDDPRMSPEPEFSVVWSMRRQRVLLFLARLKPIGCICHVAMWILCAVQQEQYKRSL